MSDERQSTRVFSRSARGLAADEGAAILETAKGVLEYACFTARGGRVENQDRFLALVGEAGERYLFAVADGMGGHRGGAEAAEVAIAALAELWREADILDDIAGWIRRAIQRAHLAVRDLAHPGELSPPNTTLAVLVIARNQVWSGHVGDTRISRYSSTGLRHRTRDHSVTEAKLAAGRITEQQAAADPDLNLLTRSLGSREVPEPAIEAWHAPAGDLLCLASDGAWSLLSEADFRSLVAAPDLELATKQRMQARLETASPAQDNATLVLVRNPLNHL